MFARLPTRAGPYLMKRQTRGLYHGKEIRFGNNVSFSQRRTRRNWLPNVQKLTFHSQLLERSMKINVTSTALRTIDKYGGLDNYILKTKESLLPGLGMDLRQQMLDVLRQREQE